MRDELHALRGFNETNELLAVCTDPVFTVRASHSSAIRFWLRDGVRIDGERSAVVHTFVGQER